MRDYPPRQEPPRDWWKDVKIGLGIYLCLGISLFLILLILGVGK